MLLEKYPSFPRQSECGLGKNFPDTEYCRKEEVYDIVQETGIKTIPIEKKWKKAKWLSEEALQIAVKRREAKGKIYPFECRVPKNSKER